LVTKVDVELNSIEFEILADNKKQAIPMLKNISFTMTDNDGNIVLKV